MKTIKSFFVLVRWEYMPSAINETGIPALLALLFIPFSSQYVFNVIMSLLIWYGVYLSIKKFSVWSRKVVHLPTQFCSLADGRPISFLTEYHLRNF